MQETPIGMQVFIYLEDGYIYLCSLFGTAALLNLLLDRLQESKTLQIDMFPSECKFSFLWKMATLTLCPLFGTASLNSLHKRLQKIDPEPRRYSDPCYMTTFPFPFIGDRLPAERFDFTELQFEYMGRTAFSELFKTVKKLEIGGGYSQLYIQGTMGYGKSHILAVLAGLLSREGNRVVYLPDCRELARDTMHYMRTALLCAFADPPLSDVRNEIRALQSEDDVVAFCKRNRSMYFIIDQMNALDREDSNMDTVNNARKDAIQQFLDLLTPGHYQITSASSNHKTAMYMKKKQTNELKMALMGGMSAVSK